MLLLPGLLAVATTATGQLLPKALSRAAHYTTANATPTPPARQTTAYRPRQAVSYGWDAATAAWSNPLLDQLTYNAQGRPTEIVTADSATATAFRRVQYGYDAQGNQLEETTQTGNGTPWINEFRYVSTYDTQNQLTEELSQGWNGNAWQTTDGYRYLNTYVGTLLTEQTVQVLNAGSYQNDARFRYAASNGQWSEVVAQRWDGAAWVNEERLTELIWHDWPARQPASFRVQAWLSSGQWADFQRHTLSYGATGTITQLIEEAQPAGAWQNFSRYTEPYDVQGNDLGYRQEDWLNGGWVLTNELRAQLRYDAQNRLTRRTEQLYSPITAQFVNRQRINYGNFQDIITASLARQSAGPLHLYPVPATGVLYVEAADVPGTLTGPLEIRTLTGQLVQRAPATTQRGILRIPLPVLASGIYLLCLPTNRGRVIQRFVRE
ncbi:T9SS type A sorting domain-containing protein [Hymenobacter perfusus]|uniref:T9SS type A sorting domain-containing protein n=1 Tax=Hymenobacter perfusus TaxID=1236770 RepID=UPI0014772FFB|nr:T9SS type A sorting domain-containing protein [Hymenobacter perfusus]